MAVGDVVSGLSAVGASITYQPAVGVEAVITHILAMTGVNTCNLIDGGAVGTAFTYFHNTGYQHSQPKIFVNNTVYLIVNGAAGNRFSYTGIQIK